MRPTISQLRAWDTPGLGTASTTVEGNAGKLDTAVDTAMRGIDDAGSWYGKTRDAAYNRMSQEQDHAREVRNVLNQIADEAGDAATDLGFAKDHVIREVDGAIMAGYDVGEDGTVSHPDQDEDTEIKAEVDRLQAVITAGLNTVNDLDDKYGGRLRSLVADLSSMVNGQPDLVIPGIGPIDPDALVSRLKGMTPDQRAALLGGLTPEQLRRLAQADPDEIGNMDGVPFQTRIDANEVNIRNALDDERKKQPPNNDRISQLEKMLKPIDDPLAGPKGADDGKTERTFLAFKNNANGHMIEIVGAIGPNTGNVAVYVPGTNTNLNGSQSNHNAAWNLANRSGGPVILYMNGDLPQNMWPNTSDDDAFDTTPANRMAPGLVSFGHELDRTLDGAAPNAKTTYIGHSYGGSVVGTAEQLGLNADRVVYASSAGTGVIDDQPWSNPNPDVQRYSLTPPGDPIHWSQMAPMQHGGDPDTAPGVQRIDSGYYGNGDLVEGQSAHGKYWDDPESDAFQNMVKIIKGEEPEPYVWRAPDHPLDFRSPPPVILAPGPPEPVQIPPR
ncbi:hypothetical protein GOARA_043_00030 [Gordonia araii NBRC 100433]|uniref:DUF1023 domain-containing protein n=1 Tax=Gordonia araii NBRC 100433 TaxID=1073574 RepID=G7H168_9ACTN|nr:alpha/beta hydrolase [Gordonia araii]NNG96784.1 hypothetical protein [Gordonia araii NBRC 100433]GAB09528.1 hypothetical protein GOARA_043_00030 [Gordonia araii NBRC 100433]